MRSNMRRFGVATALGITGLATVFLAPAASAEVRGLDVAASEGLRAGCSYPVTVEADPPSRDGEITVGISGGSVPGNGERLGQAEYDPESGTATFQWTPKYQGRQNLFAQQFKPGQVTSAKYIEVDVQGQGLNTGSSCLPLS